MKAASAAERALILGLCAAVSALLSWGLATPDFLFIYGTPLLPALWFGLVLCIGMALWTPRNYLRILVVLSATFVAWQAAVEATLSLHDSIAPQIRSATPATANGLDFSVPAVDYLWGLCGLVGGIIGSSIVVFAIAAVLRSFRTSNCWAPPILLGTIAGFLLEFAEEPTQGGLLIHIGSLLPLFLVWQVGVAALIAYNLNKPTDAGKPLRP